MINIELFYFLPDSNNFYIGWALQRSTRQQHGYAYTDSKNYPGLVMMATPFLLSGKLFC